jgi:pyruvate/2-oxoglutarate dehydrogenase complex dihydrolipoamide dehydrogenase (E3) component
MDNFDVVVIGGGPAGVTAALRARELGAGVALVERGRMGGTCTNDGCVPTRVLAKAARLMRDTEHFARYGLAGERPAIDFGRLLTRAQQVVYSVHEKKQLLHHLAHAGVRVFASAGEAHFHDPRTVVLGDGTRLGGEKFIVCAGGRARRLAFPGGEHAITHSDVWSLERLPGAIAIVGAAATGCQLASIFAAFGARVWLLEAAARILPGEDALVSSTMAEAFRQRGIQIITGIGGLERLERGGEQLQLHYSRDGGTQALDLDAVVLAVGWTGAVEGLNLEAANVQSQRGYVVVDDYLRTTGPGIFAAGDITGRMMLVQSAGYEARVAAENAVLGARISYRHQVVPHGGFTDPEYGAVGLTEAQARQSGEDCAVAVVPCADTDRAVIDGLTEGFCKLVVSRESHRILGTHVVGEQAVEVAQVIAAGMAAGMKVDQLAGLELAYPTYSAIVGLAARQITRELGIVPLAAEWRSLPKLDLSEWERRQG